MRIVTLAMILLGVAAGASAADAPAKKLNVLFLISDDMRPDLNCYGTSIVKSPNIDKLAAAGIRFDHAYCQYPLCNPSRSSMLTGRHPVHTGVTDNSAAFFQLHPDLVSLPKLFKQNGYATLRTGKIFHGGIDDVSAWTEGAEGKGGVEVIEPDQKEPDLDGLEMILQPAPKKITPAERAKMSDRINKLEGDGEKHADYKTATTAIDYLRRYKENGKPFFLACGFLKPHSPPTAPAKFFDWYDNAKIQLPVNFAPRPTVPEGYPARSITPNGDLFINREASPEQAKEMIAAYYSSISFTDWNLGRVMDELDRQGLRDNTIVIFWGDHGYHLGEFGKWSKHGSLFEVGTRVPLIIHVPGAKGNKSTASPVIQALDLYPTLCDLCGVAPPAGLEGVSLRPLIDDPKAKWDRPAISVFRNGKMHGVAVRNSKYRYVEYNEGEGGRMLFDEAADPHELKNLATDPQMKTLVEEMSKIARPYSPGTNQ